MTNVNSPEAPVEIFPGVYKFVLPLFGAKPGPVNSYLFTGKNMTLMDTGTRQTVDLLEKGFQKLGFKFSDLDRILFTHGHIDHYGGGAEIIKRAGKKIETLSHGDDKKRIETGAQNKSETEINFARLMEIPDPYFEKFLQFKSFFLQMGENCPISTTLADNQEIQLGDYLAKIILTPGHSRGSICSFIEDKKILFSGDHILKHITPNAFVMLDDDQALPSRKSQKEYYESLSKIERINASVVYPAHGKRITDIGKTIELYRTCFQERENKILSILQSGIQSVYKIARTLFPNISGERLAFDINLAVSEVFTHLQILQEKQIVSFKIENTLKIVYEGE
jgi:glyoxylase-like metal-dependent hydrolase (beta-lactamase superfamily II)